MTRPITGRTDVLAGRTHVDQQHLDRVLEQRKGTAPAAWEPIDDDDFNPPWHRYMAAHPVLATTIEWLVLGAFFTMFGFAVRGWFL